MLKLHDLLRNAMNTGRRIFRYSVLILHLLEALGFRGLIVSPSVRPRHLRGPSLPAVRYAPAPNKVAQEQIPSKGRRVAEVAAKWQTLLLGDAANISSCWPDNLRKHLFIQRRTFIIGPRVPT